MGLKKLFQTLEDRNNPDEVESQGPFICINRPWLGKGYYFWDTFLELAHWWGNQGYNGSYVICQTYIKNDTEEILDLVGNTEQLMEFKEYTNILRKAYNNQQLTVGFVIEHMKKHIPNFPYKVIRANAIDSIKYDKKLLSQRLCFISNNTAYLDMIPPIQICLLNKKYLGTNKFEIIFPETYCKKYTI